MNRVRYFCLNLQAAMSEKRLSQRDMARLTGMSLSHFHQVLHGRVVPGLDAADHIADCLRIPLTRMIASPSESN